MVISTSVWLQVHASIMYVVSNEMAGIFVLIQFWIVILYVLLFLIFSSCFPNSGLCFVDSFFSFN
jgi:hypothetical protein